MIHPSPSSMKLQQLLGTELPIVQAPMAGVQLSALTIAASDAGALGSLPCAMLTPEAMRKELEAIRAATRKPYNVNFFCHTPQAASMDRESAWRRALAPYYKEYGIDESSIPAGPGRSPFTAEAAAVLEAYKPAVLSFHFGLPAPELVARVKKWGSKILASATTVEEARWLEAHGADAIIAQGIEAGGHRGHFLSYDLNLQPGIFALVPQVVRAVKVPVIAAGGVADAAGVRAALALGAAGVPALSRGDDERGAPRRVEERAGAPYRADQPLHWRRGARDRQSHHARARTLERQGAGFSARDVGNRAAACQGGSQGQFRLLADLVGPERDRLPRSPGGRRGALARYGALEALRAHSEATTGGDLRIVCSTTQ
jgi:hypothetical protein